MPKRIFYNVYCDESNIDNPQSTFMAIGALFVSRVAAPTIAKKIKELQDKYRAKGELKWVKASSRTEHLYEELFRYLFSLVSSDLSYRCIVVDKRQLDYKKYHEGDKELAFYKFYYQLLKHHLEQDKGYYILLDFKPSKDRNSVRRLGEFLEMVSGDSVIKHIQSYPSNENIFIQIADVLTGAVAHSWNNNRQGSKYKMGLEKTIADAIGKDDLNFESLPSHKKFNIFHIIPGKKKGS